MSTELMDLLKEGGALATLAFVIWLFAMKATPAFLKSIREQRIDFVEALNHHEKQHRAEMTDVLDRYESTLTEIQKASDIRAGDIQRRQDEHTTILREVIGELNNLNTTGDKTS